MSEVVRFSKLIIGSGHEGATWFVADQLTLQIVKLFDTEAEAKTWLAKHKPEARELLDENLEFYARLNPQTSP